MLFGVVMAILFVAALIAVCIFVLLRTSGSRDKRVAGPPIPGDELTDQERDSAIDNLTTLNQWETVRENQRRFPG